MRDDEVPPVTTNTLGMFWNGPKVITDTRPDTATAQKSREDSLNSRAYWSAAEEKDQNTFFALGSFPDKARNFSKWYEANKKDLVPGHEDKYWQQWSALYDAGFADNKV